MKSTSIIPKPVTEYDLRLLRIFKVVVENGGFAAAEGELGVTRSTISVHMSNLETRLKLKLCLRGRGGFSLTEAGQAIYHATLDLFQSLEEFSLLAGSLGQALSGELVILSSDSFSPNKQAQITQALKRIHQQGPELHLSFDGDNIANIEKALLNDKAHAGIIPSYRQIDGLSYRPLMAEPVYLCCSKAHPFFNRLDTELHAQELAAAPTIHPGIDIDAQGREQLKRLNLMARAYQFEARKTLILSGCYLGFMPQSHIQQELDLGELRLIKPSEFNYDFHLSLVHKTAPREQKKVDLIRHAFA